MVPLLVRPPLNSKGEANEQLKVPVAEFVYSPIKIFVPAVPKSLNNELLVIEEEAVKLPVPKEKVPPFVIAPATVKAPAPAVTVPLLRIVPFAIIFPDPPVNIPPELMVVFGSVSENVLFVNVIGEGIVNVLFTIVFPPNVFVFVPLNTRLL